MYHKLIKELVEFIIPPGKKVLHISSEPVLILRDNLDFIIMTDRLGYVNDIEEFFGKLKEQSGDNCRLIITQYSKLWEPILKIAAAVKLSMPYADQSWISLSDIENFLYLTKFEVISKGTKVLLPIYVPILSTFCNKYLVNIFPFNKLALVNYIIARKSEIVVTPARVSIIVPAKNEAGMIHQIVQDLPQLGTHTELIFIEGNSTDNTWEVIEEVSETYRGPFTIKIARQEGKGKGDAVRKGFDMATGEILMIYDADMTVPPSELPKFYRALVEGRGDFINGSRLVYPMKKLSMQTLNFVANKVFSLIFSWLLGQKVKDTLCGTKVLWKKDYQDIKANRHFFGDFDPFGDFDLLFGAAKLNLKIIDMPIHYRERVYGSTNISRWKHGWLLLRMVLFAMRKIKFI